MTPLLGAIFSLSISIPCVIGLVRYRRVDPANHPFIHLMWIGLVHEIISIVLIHNRHPNLHSYNVFALAQAFVCTKLFQRWGIFRGNRWLYAAVQLSYICFWVLEYSASGFRHFASYFIVYHSFIIVLLSIHQLNSVVFNDSGLLLRSSTFLICMSFISYFTYTVLTEVFWIYGLNRSRVFQLRVYTILAYINLIVNFIYALAILWMPMRRQYILRS
jgi:hypothetical protein